MSVLDLIPQTEKETLKFRLLAVLVVAFASLLQADEVSLLPTLAVVGGYLAYSYVLRTFLIPKYTSYPLLGIMLLIDVGTVLAALRMIGLDSPIFGLLPVVVVYYSMYLGYTGGISAAIVSTLGYTGLVFGTDQVSEMKNLLAIQSFFFIVALLVGYITQQRFSEGQARQALQQLINAEASAKSLLDLTQTLNRAIDPLAVSSDMARIGALVARVPFCIIFVHDPERDALVYQGSNLSERLSPANDEGELLQPLGSDSFLSSAWMSETVTYLDRQEGDGVEALEWLKGVEVHRALAYLLTNSEEKIGVVCFVTTATTPGFSEETVEAVRDFSETAGRILARTQVYSRTERRSRRVAADLQQSIETAGRFRELGQRRSMRFGSLLLEPSRELVRWQDTSLRLTKMEFDLLYVLAEKPGVVVNQETLIREVWGQDYVPQGKVVDVTVHRLRRKLATLPEGTKLIQTVRGQGYTFVPPERFVSTS